MNPETDPWWHLLQHRGRVEELNQTECFDLLHAKNLGRIGYLSDHGPRIVPMNYAFLSGFIYLCTSPTSEAAAFTPDRTVAFEVDEVDEFLQGGWSVLVVGAVTALSPEHVPTGILGPLPEPWAAGDRNQFLQIEIEQITGRRIHPT